MWMGVGCARNEEKQQFHSSERPPCAMAYKDLTGARMDECPPYQLSPYHTQLQSKGVA